MSDKAICHDFGETKTSNGLRDLDFALLVGYFIAEFSDSLSLFFAPNLESLKRLQSDPDRRLPSENKRKT
jgi:hypothetical protein